MSTWIQGRGKDLSIQLALLRCKMPNCSFVAQVAAFNKPSRKPSGARGGPKQLGNCFRVEIELTMLGPGARGRARGRATERERARARARVFIDLCVLASRIRTSPHHPHHVYASCCFCHCCHWYRICRCRCHCTNLLQLMAGWAISGRFGGH